MSFNAFSLRNNNLVSPPSDERGHRAALPPAIPVGRFFYSGFTLLEMLLVLFIMGLLASAATVMTDSLDTQARYDETKRRMTLVKRAIAGDVSRSINGQPDLGGFVADIGRPPATMQELLEQGALPAFSQDSGSGLWVGWRGPYLDAVGAKVFHDGYGNPGSAVDNYGWDFDVSASGVLSLISNGADTTVDTDDIADTELLTADDYELTLATVKINFHNRRGADSVAQASNLLLRIYSPAEGVVANDDSDAFSLAAVSSVQSVQVSASFSPELDVPMGARGYAVVCVSTGKLFDGDCDAGNAALSAANVMQFTVVPRAQPTAFEWVLQ